MTQRPELKPVKQRHDRRSPGVTYQLEHVLCNKPGCRQLHGPYWYAYWKVGGRMRKKYVGKSFKLVRKPAIEALGNRLPKPPAGGVT